MAGRRLDESLTVVYAVTMSEGCSKPVAFADRESNVGREAIDCRPGCGACCIAPSISTPIPGMPEGKPAGVRCIQLTADNHCKLFGKPERPAVCVRLRPTREMCGESDEAAMIYLTWLETQTS